MRKLSKLCLLLLCMSCVSHSVLAQNDTLRNQKYDYKKMSKKVSSYVLSKQDIAEFGKSSPASFIGRFGDKTYVILADTETNRVEVTVYKEEDVDGKPVGFRCAIYNELVVVDEKTNLTKSQVEVLLPMLLAALQ